MLIEVAAARLSDPRALYEECRRWTEEQKRLLYVIPLRRIRYRLRVSLHAQSLHGVDGCDAPCWNIGSRESH